MSTAIEAFQAKQMSAIAKVNREEWPTFRRVELSLFRSGYRGITGRSEIWSNYFSFKIFFFFNKWKGAVEVCFARMIPRLKCLHSPEARFWQDAFTHEHRVSSQPHNNNDLTAPTPTPAMESWKNGRRDLFNQLTNICDHIEQNVAAGRFYSCGLQSVPC